MTTTVLASGHSYYNFIKERVLEWHHVYRKLAVYIDLEIQVLYTGLVLHKTLQYVCTKYIAYTLLLCIVKVFRKNEKVTLNFDIISSSHEPPFAITCVMASGGWVKHNIPNSEVMKFLDGIHHMWG